MAILVAIVAVARVAARTPRSRTTDDGHLRLDDLIFLLLGIVPGAIVGARLGYVVTHADFYAANPGAVLDTAQGGLELTLAVVGGTLTGGAAARLLGEPVRRWLHVAALPLLAGIALGKVALALGGEGQGTPSGAAWATSYIGPGPWGSLAPAIPSHPAQLYEAAATLLVLLLVMAAGSAGAFRERDGRAFLAALGGWGLARAIVAVTWRDAGVAGPLNAEQLLCLGLVVGCAVGAVALARRRAEVDAPRDAEWRETRAEQPL
jgi:phosphatidylglycerol:prolipoprotein diacylglycerol transferase